MTGVVSTDYQYTGQFNDSYIKLYWYGSRWYDPYLGRFIQADTVVPGISNPNAWDRYSYVFFNPLRFIDPGGYCPTCKPLIDGEYSVEYALEHADKIGECPSSHKYHRKPVITDNHYYDHLARRSGTLKGVTLIGVPLYVPPDTYPEQYWDLFGRPIMIDYGQNKASKAVGVGDAITVLNEYLYPYVPLDYSTIEASLYYSLYGDNFVILSGLSVNNNSSARIFVTSIKLYGYSQIHTYANIGPGKSEQIGLAGGNYLSDGFLGAELTIMFYNPEINGLLPAEPITFSPYDVYFR